MNLTTPGQVRRLQNVLHAKAKAEPRYRFYSLWDKVCRGDVLGEAWRRCRRNAGAAGVDGVCFEEIEGQGVERFLGNLQEELRTKKYRPQPLLRVWIPKRSGGQRALSIPTVRDRVVQAAMVLVLDPIFDADLADGQFGFRVGRDAKMALRAVLYELRQRGRSEVVDADLADYFNTIPHGPLMKCVARRVSDGQVLSTIRAWLNTPVVERRGRQEHRTAEARKGKRGTPQGGVISPMLANLYFRRFMLGWSRAPDARACGGVVVNYADDFVICCTRGQAEKAMKIMRRLMTRLGLQVHERKTRVADAARERFDFLGYTVGRFYTKDGRPYIGTAPSQKAISRVVRRIHDETSKRQLSRSIENRIEKINSILRGWCSYFNQGPVHKAYNKLGWYSQRRLQRWLAKKHKKPGSGYRQFPHEYLYGELGLYRPMVRSRRLPRAKA